MKTIFLLIWLMGIVQISTAQELRSFSNSLTKKKKEKTLYGFKDKSGNIVVPLKYNDCSFSFKNGVSMVVLDNKIGLIDEKGNEIVPPIYDKMGDRDSIIDIYIGGKAGVINLKGEVLVPPKYDDIIILKKGSVTILWVKLDEKWGIIDQKGNEIAPLKYTSYSYSKELGKTQVYIGNKTGYINELNGKEITPVKYNKIYETVNGYSKVDLNNKWGIIDQEGNEIIPPKYDEINKYVNGYAKASLDNKFGYIDGKGNEIIPVIYDEIADFSIDSLKKAKLNGKWGLMDDRGKEIIPFKYESIFNFTYATKDLVQVMLGGKYGIFSLKQNKELVAPQYKEILKLDDDRADKNIAIKAKDSIQQKMGLLDSLGNLFVPIRYDVIFYFRDKLAIVSNKDSVSKKDLYGIINSKGKEVVPVKYKQARYNFGPDPFELMKKDETGRNAIDYANEVSVEDGNLVKAKIKKLFHSDSLDKVGIKEFAEERKDVKLLLPEWNASFNYDCTYSNNNNESNSSNYVNLNKKIEVTILKYMMIIRNLPGISEELIDISIIRSYMEKSIKNNEEYKYYFYYFKPNNYGLISAVFQMKYDRPVKFGIEKNEGVNNIQYFCE